MAWRNSVGKELLFPIQQLLTHSVAGRVPWEGGRRELGIMGFIGSQSFFLQPWQWHLCESLNWSSLFLLISNPGLFSLPIKTAEGDDQMRIKTEGAEMAENMHYSPHQWPNRYVAQQSKMTGVFPLSILLYSQKKPRKFYNTSIFKTNTYDSIPFLQLSLLIFFLFL